MLSEIIFCYYYWYSIKLQEPNTFVMLKMDSDVGDRCISPNQSQTLCLPHTAACSGTCRQVLMYHCLGTTLKMEAAGITHHKQSSTIFTITTIPALT